MKGKDLGHSFPNKRRGIKLQLFWFEKIRIIRLDHQGAVSIGFELAQLLMERRHPPEFSEHILERFSFHDRLNTFFIQKSTVADRQKHSFCLAIGECPGISFLRIGGEVEMRSPVDPQLDSGSPLAKRSFGASEYSLVGSFSCLISLFQEEKVAAFLLGSTEDDGLPLAKSAHQIHCFLSVHTRFPVPSLFFKNPSGI